jgi:hypothetical protein
MTMPRIRRLSICVLAAAANTLAIVAIAAAARAPTPTERASILRASPIAHYLAHAPTSCVHIDVAVSRDGLFAEVGARFGSAKACTRWTFNGFELFRRTPPSWTLIYVGSDPPPCSFGVARDLVACIAYPQGPRPHLAAAKRLVRRLGFLPRPGPWEEALEFNALVAARGSVTRVYFFRGARLLGTGGGTTVPTYAWRGEDVIAIRYASRCAPVRYALHAGRLRRLDPLSGGSTPPRC